MLLTHPDGQQLPAGPGALLNSGLGSDLGTGAEIPAGALLSSGLGSDLGTEAEILARAGAGSGEEPPPPPSLEK